MAKPAPIDPLSHVGSDLGIGEFQEMELVVVA
jgi:hypothetical protein